MWRTLKTIVLPILTGLALLGLIGLAGSALFLYREAAAVHPALGWGVIVLLAAGVGLLIVYPIVRLLRLPGVLLRPAESSGPSWERFLQRYAKRLQSNPLIRNGYSGYEGLTAEISRPSGNLEKELEGALRHLDGLARDTIARHAAAVFTATAVSQSGRLDAAIVISAQLRMVKEIAEIYYQRPRPRELWALYANVGASTFLAGEIQDSEVLAVLGAPVSAGLAGFIPVAGVDPLISLLVNSLLDGSANAFLTLRVGAVARRYCGLRLEGDRRAVSRSASVEAATLLGGVVSQGAARIAAMTRKLILEGAARGTTRAAKGVVGLGGSLFGKIFEMVGKAGMVAADSTTRGIKALQESLRFWENVAGETAEETAGEPAPSPTTDSAVRP